MLCKKPFLGSLRCSTCLPCRVHRRRVLTHRIILESLCHQSNCFVTLTYDSVHLPQYGSLNPRDYSLWLKRLRKSFSPVKLRFLLSGEYGDITQRPHYHIALFGADQITAGGFDGAGGLVNSTWGKGNTYVGSLTSESAAYVAGYVTKKFVSSPVGDRIDDLRIPEFRRMSLRPGLGAKFAKFIADSLGSTAGLDSIVANAGMPASLRHLGRLLPIGRYLNDKVRKELGLSKELINKDAVVRFGQEMRRLYEEDVATAKAQKVTLFKVQSERRNQLLTNCETRFKLYSTGGKL